MSELNVLREYLLIGAYLDFINHNSSLIKFFHFILNLVCFFAGNGFVLSSLIIVNKGKRKTYALYF